MTVEIEKIKKLSQLVRYDIITSTTTAGSGHPSSALSAVELMATLLFGNFLAESDKLIFSKGHAAPLLYSLYHAAGLITFDELMTLRAFNSRLEGHPTPRFPYVEIATGSLGQGLSIGLGMSLGMKLRGVMGGGSRRRAPAERGEAGEKHGIESSPRVFVLLGDSEMAEGQIWEAMQIASYYKLNNLIAILDVNRLGQRGETMLGWNIDVYVKRAQAFGWNTLVVEDGHDINQITNQYKKVADTYSEPIAWAPPGEAGEEYGIKTFNKPTIVIAKTIKGRGVSFMEDQNGWHGKPIPKERLQEALKELGNIDLNIRGKTNLGNHKSQISNNNPACRQAGQIQINLKSKIYDLGSNYSTREAYGDALVTIGESNDKIVVLDAETSNSTYADKFAKKFTDRFFEMFIAEQNMVSAALGLSKQGFIPFVSTFAAFLTRAYDQIRMSQYSNANLKICGSHCGVSIGPDGPSQMGLEDIAMFSSILNSVILYPSDAVSAFKLTQLILTTDVITYLRTTREKLPLVYKPEEEFKIGGSKILKQSDHDKCVVFAVGITLHEALKAYDALKKEGIDICVVDLYSVKPIDSVTINRLIGITPEVVVVEDHYPSGGLGEAVLSALGSNETMKQCSNFSHLCVKKLPRSGTPEELLAYEEINSKAIVQAVKSIK